MTPRLWVLSLAPALAASHAYAQAPGDVAPETYYAPPSATPTPPPPPQAAPAWQCGYAAPIPVMAHRWAIGVSFGGMGVAPEDAPEGSEARFRIGEISLRYRASRRIELQLALSGGRQMIEDDAEGDLATGTVMLALRYRFMPEHRWNWYVMGGLGGTVVAPHQSTSAERDAAQRPLGALGVGIERRFQRFALSAEVRAVGLGEREDAMGADVPVSDGGAAPPKPLPRLPASSAAVYAEQLSGGMFTIGASYYF
jgi:hypothetical protein